MNEYKGYIYFAECVEEKSVTIGFTTNLTARLANIRTNKESKEITLLGYLEGARSIKKEMHEKFHKLRIFGSWFHLTDEFREWIEIFTKHDSISSGHIAEEVEEVKSEKKSKEIPCNLCGGTEFIVDERNDKWCVTCKKNAELERSKA